MTTIPTWRNLKASYLKALDEGRDWLDLWRLFVEHPWYQEQLQMIAERLVRRCPNAQMALDDVKQDAMLLLARKLRGCPDMRLDRELIETHFGGWMGTIIRRDCQEALRRSRRPQPLSSEAVSDDLSPGRPIDLEARIDLSMSLDQLPDALRAVLVLHYHGWLIQEIAAELDLSYWKVRRQLLEGLRQMAEKLRPPAD